ncbi:MAG: hypothetical protein KDJ52_27555 [Anaerolineae bacterium]|nr:hypothetical protein [Anaerolineae bacterium]
MDSTISPSYSYDNGDGFEPKETQSGQSPLAYRLAAAVLFGGILINVADAFWGASPNIMSIIIDIAVVIGLLRLSRGARGWALFRAAFGAIVGPILFFTNNDPITAGFMSILTWSITGSILLLLTGNSRPWRLILGSSIFVIFGIGLYGLIFLLALIGIALGG